MSTIQQDIRKLFEQQPLKTFDSFGILCETSPSRVNWLRAIHTVWFGTAVCFCLQWAV